MHKVILFRGGMFGDVVLSMLNKKYVRSIYPLKNVRERYVMKKFYNFSLEKKYKYVEKMDGYTLSHDTDFCKKINEDQVVQIFCSDTKMLTHMADRFWIFNEYESVAHVKKDLQLNKDKTLAQDFEAWQTFHVFKNRFDIKNIYKKNFVDDLQKSFEIHDYNWAKTIHNIWLTKSTMEKFGKYLYNYEQTKTHSAVVNQQ